MMHERLRRRPGLRSLLVACLVASVIVAVGGLGARIDLGGLAGVLGVAGVFGSVGAMRGKRSGFVMLLVLCAIGFLAGASRYGTDETRGLPIFSAYLAAMGAALGSCQRTFSGKRS